MSAQIPLTGSLGPNGPFAILGFSLPVITGNADHVLTVAEYSSSSLKVTSDGTSTAIRKVVAPLAQGMLFFVENLTSEGFAITFGGASGSSVTIPSGATLLVTCVDGADYVSPAAGAGASIIIADAAHLTALPASGLPNGTTAVVQTFGAIFALSAAGPTVDGVTVLAASDGRIWQRGITLIAPAALAQSVWQVDPAAGSDEASGGVGAALKSFAEITRRWGTRNPSISVAVTITLLSDQPQTDAIYCYPVFIGSGTLTIQGTLVAAGSLTLGTFVAANLGTGTAASINVAGHTWTPGTLVHDTSKNASFWIDADLGGGTARITQAFVLPINSNAPTPIALANGDALSLFTPSIVVINKVGPQTLGSGVNAFSLRQAQLQGSSFCATFGTGINVFESSLDNSLLFIDTTIPGLPPLFCSVWIADFFGTGAIIGALSVYGGAINGSGSEIFGGSFLDYDVLVNLRNHTDGGVVGLGRVYFAQWFEDTTLFGVTARYIVGQGNAGAPRIWGAATISIATGQQLFVQDGTAVAGLLVTGGLTIDGASTAFPIVLATGIPGAAVAITPANLDANKALLQPRTNSRMFVN